MSIEYTHKILQDEINRLNRKKITSKGCPCNDKRDQQHNDHIDEIISDLKAHQQYLEDIEYSTSIQ